MVIPLFQRDATGLAQNAGMEDTAQDPPTASSLPGASPAVMTIVGKDRLASSSRRSDVNPARAGHVKTQDDARHP